MASIQLRADIVITACNKFWNKKKENADIDFENLIDIEDSIAEVETIKRIKKLAEYAIKPVKIDGEWSKSGSQEPVTITHNDFELIGGVFMKTKYKYIHFKEIDSTGKKTSIWECINNNSLDVLGFIRWYSSWRQYYLFPREYIAFNKGCLEDINNFITQLMDERKNTKS